MNINAINLAKRQSILIQSILEIGDRRDIQGEDEPSLALYRLNLALSASRALQISFPVLTQLIGEEAVGYLSRIMLKQSPPNSGDWADWGATLEEIIAGSPLAEEYPYLSDMAKLEWKVSQSARAQSTVIDVSSLDLLKTEELDSLKIIFSPSLQLIASHYPVDRIWRLHKKPSLEYDTLIQHDGGRCYQSIIFQHDQIPRVSDVNDREFLWIQRAINGDSIGRLLDEIPGFDFASWLANALEMNQIQRLDIKPKGVRHE